MAPAVDAREGGALSFLSRSLLDVQRSADQDIKLMQARAKSFRDLAASSLDKEWENFRFPSLSLGQRQQASPGGIAPMSPLAISSQVEDMDFFKRLKPTFRRIQSDSSLSSKRDSMDLSLIRKALAPLADEHTSDTTTRMAGRQVLTGEAAGGAGSTMFIREKKKKRRSAKLPSSDDWGPLKRVKDGLKDLETSAAASKSPSEFFQNVKKTELYENVKNSLKLNLPASDGAVRLTEEQACEVAPLDVPELLENLVRQSEPFLDQLGVRKDVPIKLCKMLRKGCKRPDNGRGEAVSTAASTSSTEDDELDVRVASVLQSTGYRYKGGLWGGETREQADISGGKRRIAIVTTASLPWLTGTAVNPLFRAAYLAKDGMRNVTLLIPWLSQADQQRVHPDQMTFNCPEEQESYVRRWVEERVGFHADFKIAFYPGKFSTHKRSILACGDISRFIPDREADVAVLEEPEHLTWYYHGQRWNKKFRDVIGIVHTNYLEYIKREKNGALQAFLVKHINNWVVGIYCNKVLRLSAATQELPKSTVCNVHGVSPRFLEIGRRVSSDGGKPVFSKGAYFLGKMIWGKGYRELVDLLAQHKQELGDLKLDVYGSGDDAAEVKSAATSLGLGIRFHQGRDHADEALHSYKVFINPSISDVVCTTTAEALAMGKLVVCADHPSNEFFMSFPNCLTYRNPSEFVQRVKQAMLSEPLPLSAEERHRLSWEAATERFLQYAELGSSTPGHSSLSSSSMNSSSLNSSSSRSSSRSSSLSLPMYLRQLVDGGLALAHFVATGIEPARLASGAIPGTLNFTAQQRRDLRLPPPPPPVLLW